MLISNPISEHYPNWDVSRSLKRRLSVAQMANLPPGAIVYDLIYNQTYRISDRLSNTAHYYRWTRNGNKEQLLEMWLQGSVPVDVARLCNSI